MPLGKSVFSPFPLGQVRLLPGLFFERRQLVRDYILRLSTAKVLQNHLAEAGIRVDTPSKELYHGWEDPHCQLRGHFAGHWLSSLARFSAIDDDPLVRARLAEAVSALRECQNRNGGGWAGSVPPKYLDLLERGYLIWSPQYTLHKTLSGLVDAAFLSRNTQALDVLNRWTDWYVSWCRGLTDRGRIDVVYQGECAGMLELWADLYGRTKDDRYLELAQWYASPDLFDRILKESDPLSHTHANATIPWLHGAARLYEVTGDLHYREIVEQFWNKAVATRGMFATTGSNAGEYWVPPQGHHQYLGDRTQEHCTVYNMIRLAEFLHRWTGEVQFADYVERALYNGILAQQHSKTGMVCYFLPMSPGATKTWGTETEDFWCCHGTLVQAHTLVEELVFHRRDGGYTIDQFIASVLKDEGVEIRLNMVTAPDQIGRCLEVLVEVLSTREDRWSLSIRRPSWLAGEPEFVLDGQSTPSNEVGGYYTLERLWSQNTLVFRFPQEVRKEYLPGSTDRFAFIEGPVVLAAVSKGEVVGVGNLTLVPAREHQYIGGREWQSHHYRASWGDQSFPLVPLYEVAEQPYSIYCREKS